MPFNRLLLAFAALSLSACASIVATANGPAPERSLMFAGTQLNASIISGGSCEDTGRPSHGCAYDHALAPFSLIDFLPSLALDTVLLPYTALHAALASETSASASSRARPTAPSAKSVQSPATTTAAPGALTYGTVAQWLQAAEAGQRPALHALAAGARQLSPDADDLLAAVIDARQIPPEHTALFDDATAALAIALVYTRAQPDDEALVFYCTWARRALALYRPAPGDDTDTQLKWATARETLEPVIEPLTAAQRQQCQTQAAQWTLQPPAP